MTDIIKMEMYDSTPFIELHKGLFQNGGIWRILDTRRPAVYKIYFTMVSLALLTPDVRNKHAEGLFDKYTNKGREIICWLSYRQIRARCHVSSTNTIKKALDELKEKGLIKDTDDDGVYKIGYIPKRFDPIYRLYLHDILDHGPDKVRHLSVLPSETPTCLAK